MSEVCWWWASSFEVPCTLVGWAFLGTDSESERQRACDALACFDAGAWQNCRGRKSPNKFPGQTVVAFRFEVHSWESTLQFVAQVLLRLVWGSTIQAGTEAPKRWNAPAATVYKANVRTPC